MEWMESLFYSDFTTSSWSTVVRFPFKFQTAQLVYITNSMRSLDLMCNMHYTAGGISNFIWRGKKSQSYSKRTRHIKHKKSNKLIRAVMEHFSFHLVLLGFFLICFTMFHPPHTLHMESVSHLYFCTSKWFFMNKRKNESRWDNMRHVCLCTIH